MPISTRLTYLAAVLVLFGTGQIPFSGAEESDSSPPAEVLLAQDLGGEAADSAVIQSVQTSEAVAVSKDVGPLQIIGVLSASHMYTTYGYISVTADALTKKVYSPEQARELMTEVSAMCDNIIDQMAHVNRKELTAEDLRTIDEMISIYRQLKVEAEALKTFASQRTDKTAAEYETARRNVWPRIEQLLGLKPEK